MSAPAGFSFVLGGGELGQWIVGWLRRPPRGLGNWTQFLERYSYHKRVVGPIKSKATNLNVNSDVVPLGTE